MVMTSSITFVHQHLTATSPLKCYGNTKGILFFFSFKIFFFLFWLVFVHLNCTMTHKIPELERGNSAYKMLKKSNKKGPVLGVFCLNLKGEVMIEISRCMIKRGHHFPVISLYCESFNSRMNIFKRAF